MFTHLRQFFAKPRFVDQERKRAVALLYGPNLLLAGCGLLVATLGFLIARQRAWEFSVAAVAILAVAGGAQVLLRRGYVQIVGALLSISALLLLTASALLGEWLQPVVAGGYVLVISLAGFLVGWQGAVACGVLSLASVVIAHAAGPRGAAGTSRMGGLALMSGVVASATLVVSAVTRRIGSRQESSGQPEEKVASRGGELEKLNASLRQRLDLLQTATGLASQVGSLLVGHEIANRTVALVHEMLGVEWVGLFIREPAEQADDGDAAERELLALVASRGEANVLFGSPREGMSPNARALLARCLDGGGPRVAEESDRGWALRAVSAGMRRPSLLLIPLRVQEEAVGVLALKPGVSVSADTAFIDAVQYAADQVALALHRANAYARLRVQADESERLVRRYVEESWDGLVAARPHLAGYRYTPYRCWADERAWLPPMTRAVQEGVLVVEESAGETLLAIPLVQSGITIGAIGLRRPEDQRWSEDEQLLVLAASEQVTQALENRRLFELAHDRAQRERLLRRITERIRSQADLDGSLRVAADQLRKVTGATHVAIRLGRADKDA